MSKRPVTFRVIDQLRRTVVAVPLLVLLLVVGALVVIVAGFFPIGAKGGHIPPLGDLFPYVRSQSVAFYSRYVPPAVVSLEEAAVVQRGASHYAAACASCHGAPGMVQPKFTEGMLPMPPHLAETDLIENRSPEELYFVVAEGIKSSGMGAWPAEERPSEIWSVVAFLERLRGMGEEEYRRLAAVEAPPAPELAGVSASVRGQLESCARCHGYDGVGKPSGAFPNLSLLEDDYMRLSLRAYKEERRHSGIMQTQIHPVSREAIGERIEDVAEEEDIRVLNPTYVEVEVNE